MAKPAVFTWPAASATAIAAVQTTTNVVAQNQTLGGAGNLTLNGSLVSGGIAYIPAAPQFLSLTSAGNLSAVNFTIAGTNSVGAVIGEVVAGPNANTIYSVNQYATVTSIAAAGAAANISVGTIMQMTLTSSVIKFPGISRTISLTSTLNMSAVNFTVTGTLGGVTVSETRAGPNNNTVNTVQLFDGVTSISANLSFTSVSAGTGALGYTDWWLYNYQATVVGFSAQVEVAGTINYTFQSTLDDVQTDSSPYISTVPAAAMTMNNVTASMFSPYNNVLRYVRVAIVAGTTTGSLVATFLQQGIT